MVKKRPYKTYTVVGMYRFSEEVVTDHIKSYTPKHGIRAFLRKHNQGIVVVDVFEGKHVSVSPYHTAVGDAR